MELTFLAAPGDRRLAKTITPTETHDYPSIKRVTSSTQYIDLTSKEALDQLIVVLGEQGAAGAALLKGPLKRPLNDESRRGLHNTTAPSQLLIVDIDGLNAEPLGIRNNGNMAGYLRRAAEAVVARLPAPFPDTGFVVQASSSFGRKIGQISMHLFFLMQQELAPAAIKDLLVMLNFSDELFENQLRLTPAGLSLSYRIDPCLADNSRLCYITPPIFTEDSLDPFRESSERIQLIRKPRSNVLLDVLSLLPTPEAVDARVRAKVRALRRAAGLPPRKEKIVYVTEQGERVPVTANMGRVRMTMAADCGEFVRYNVNNGDSNAYWVHKYDPVVVYNFKAEPNFLFKEADPEAYEAHINTFRDPDKDDADLANDDHTPLVFLDYASNRYFYGMFDRVKGKMRSIHQCSYDSIRHFLAQNNVEMPETVPVWDYRFEPENPVLVDFNARFMNMYSPPDVLEYPATVPNDAVGLRLGYAASVLEKLCPQIHMLLLSICGDGMLEYEYFLNWLAFIVQRKRKTMTAWVFHGVQGTGKGVLYNHVLAPLLGSRHVNMKRLEDVEERFNEWMEHCLLFVVDEFRADNSKQMGMVNKLKNMITEQRGTIRPMGRPQRECTLFANVIFFSNDHDAQIIEPSDRRFNIAPRQETPLIARQPDVFDVVEENCARELPLFASVLLQYKVDETKAMTALDNEAKRQMKEASSDSIDLFVHALQTGDLDYFLPILDMVPKGFGADDYVGTAKLILRTILREFVPGYAYSFWNNELMALYNCLVGKQDNEQKFAKLLGRHGLKKQDVRKSFNGASVVRKGFRTEFNLISNDIEELRRVYLQQSDYTVTDTKDRRELRLN